MPKTTLAVLLSCGLTPLVGGCLADPDLGDQERTTDVHLRDKRCGRDDAGHRIWGGRGCSGTADLMVAASPDLATVVVVVDAGTAPRDLASADLKAPVQDLTPPRDLIPPPADLAVVADLKPPPADLTVVGGGGGGLNLCNGLITDKLAHPMTALAKPALGQTVIDAQFGGRIRRITQVAATGGSPSIRPLYSTVSAWNADETRMMLYNVETGDHQLYDGRTYAFIRNLDINPPDLEQVFWHTTDPDVFFYVSGRSFIRYHVASAVKETVTTFTFCVGGASSGGDPMFTSWDSHRIGLRCDNQVFIYDVSTNTVIARKTLSEKPGQVAPSGKLAYLSDSGRVTDSSLNVLRTLDLREPYGHASLGRLPTGEDTWNGAVFDSGPAGNSDIGSLVTFTLATGSSKVVIGPKTGYPYPPDGHISAMAYKNPGWVFVSTFGNTSGAGLLDMEMVIANTGTGVVCRAGRHRTWGKSNTHLQEPYWAEAHMVPSPRGTRAVFASDWGNGTTVDAYVLELAGYVP